MYYGTSYNAGATPAMSQQQPCGFGQSTEQQQQHSSGGRPVLGQQAIEQPWLVAQMYYMQQGAADGQYMGATAGTSRQGQPRQGPQPFQHAGGQHGSVSAAVYTVHDDELQGGHFITANGLGGQISNENSNLSRQVHFTVTHL